LLALVLCCGAIFWAWRVVWDERHPLLAAVRGLQARDPSQRLAAVREVTDLSFGQSGAAIRSLIMVLDDPDLGVRAAAAQSLGLVGSQAVKVGSDSEAVRAATTGLLGLLKDQHTEVRLAAATGLGAIVMTSPSSSGRGSGQAAKTAVPPAASAVDFEAVDAAFVALLGDPDDGVRQAALVALGALAPRIAGDPPQALFAALEEASAAQRAAAVAVLSRFPRGLDPLIPWLLRHLERDEPQVRAACTEALGGIRPPAVSKAVVPALIAGLGNRDREVRFRVVALIGRLAPDAHVAVPALITILREPSDSDQPVEGMSIYTSYSGPAHAAARELGRIAPGTDSAGEAIAALTEVVRSGPPRRRAAAASALGAFGAAAAAAVPAVITLLRENAASEVPSRDGESTARALGRIAPNTPSAAKAVTALTDALGAHSEPTREAAVTALASFGSQAAGAIPAIRTLQEKDPNPGVRKAAAATLEKIKAGSK
jgi:HEAT repeat protein